MRLVNALPMRHHGLAIQTYVAAIKRLFDGPPNNLYHASVHHLGLFKSSLLDEGGIKNRPKNVKMGKSEFCWELIAILQNKFGSTMMHWRPLPTICSSAKRVFATVGFVGHWRCGHEAHNGLEKQILSPVGFWKVRDDIIHREDETALETCRKSFTKFTTCWYSKKASIGYQVIKSLGFTNKRLTLLASYWE